MQKGKGDDIERKGMKKKGRTIRGGRGRKREKMKRNVTKGKGRKKVKVREKKEK